MARTRSAVGPETPAGRPAPPSRSQRLGRPAAPGAPRAFTPRAVRLRLQRLEPIRALDGLALTPGPDADADGGGDVAADPHDVVQFDFSDGTADHGTADHGGADHGGADQGGAVRIDAGADANDGAADRFAVSEVDGRLVVSVNGRTAYDADAADPHTLRFAGSADADHLFLDPSLFAGGGAGGGDLDVAFDGAGGADRVELGGAVGSVAHHLLGGAPLDAADDDAADDDAADDDAADGADDADADEPAANAVAADGLNLDYRGVEQVADRFDAAARTLTVDGAADLHGTGTEGVLTDGVTTIAFAADASELGVNADALTITGALDLAGNDGTFRAGDSLSLEPGAELRSAGGSLTLDGGASLVVSGTVDVSTAPSPQADATASGATASGGTASGGTASLLGGEITLTDTAVVDASGTAGGGAIYVGGGYQGADPALSNAEFTTIAEGARLDANALAPQATSPQAEDLSSRPADGGTIIVWANDTTRFAGQISARGLGSGDGGFAEVSGKEHVLVTGHADLRSAGGPDGGTFGTFLIDPGSVDIVHTNDELGNGPDQGMDRFEDAWIADQLNNASLSIFTSASTNGGNEVITVEGDVAIGWFAATTLTLVAGRSIVVQSGARVEATGDGAIDFRANEGGTTAGNFTGMSFTGATLQTRGAGGVTLSAQGASDGASSSSGNRGVVLDQTTVIEATGTGDVNVTAIGGAGEDSNIGLFLGLRSAIRSADGAVTVVGEAGSNGTSGSSQNWGVYLVGFGTIESTGAGDVTVTGVGGAGEDDNYGVQLEARGAIRSADGDLTVDGTGGSAGLAGSEANVGIRLHNNGVIESTGAGAVTVTGLAGTGRNGGGGVTIDTGNSAIRSVDGDLTVTGTGTLDEANAAASASVRGVAVFPNGVIESTGSGNVSVTGTGGVGAPRGHGVQLGGEGAAIRSGGNLSVTGTAGSASADAVLITSGATVQTAGIGVVTLNAANVAAGGTPFVFVVDDDSPGAPAAGADYGQLDLTGTLDLTGGPALALSDLGSTGIAVGDVYTLIDNDGSDAIAGTFGGLTIDGAAVTDGDLADGSLDEGDTFAFAGRDFTASYVGGDGNDFTLTAVVAGPTVTVDGDGNLRIADAAGADDRLTIALEAAGGSGGSDVVLTQTDGGAEVARVAAATVTGGIFVDLAAGDDTLTVDASLLLGGYAVDYEGGDQGSGGGDALALTDAAGTTAFDTITHTFVDANSGSVAFALSGATLGSVTYAGLEPIADDLNAADRRFVFTGGAETITLEDVNAGGSGGADGFMRIDSTLGESVTFLNPTAGLTIDAGSGDDTVTIASVDGAYRASLTIAGGDGDDAVNLFAGLTLGSAAAGNAGDLTATGEAILVTRSIDTTAATANGGTGDVTLTAGRTITVSSSAAAITTADGDVTLRANADGTATGFFTAVQLFNGSVRTTGAGDIEVIGVGAGAADGTSRFKQGVFLNEAVVEAAGTGTISVTGTGGIGVQDNVGVVVAGSGGAIRAAGGEIAVTGFGGSNGAADSLANHGVLLLAGGVIETTAGGAVSVAGTAGVGQNQHVGVVVRDADSAVRSAGGGVTVTGTGGSNGQDGGNANHGVQVVGGGTIAATGSGDVSVTGTGGAGVNNNVGVLVSGTNGNGVASAIRAADGDVTVDGTGAARGSTGTRLNVGVRVDGGGRIEAAGALTVEGEGGLGRNDNLGVFVVGAGSGIVGSGGAVRVTGTGNAALINNPGDNADGVRVQFGGTIAHTDAAFAPTMDDPAAVIVTGTVEQSRRLNVGVRVVGGSIVAAGGGVSVTGTSAGDLEQNRGVVVTGGGLIADTGGGAVSVTGTGGDGTDDNEGVLITGGSSAVRAAGGGVSVTGFGGSDGTAGSEGNRGVAVTAGGRIEDLGGGAVTVGGTGGAGGNFNEGVYVANSGGGRFAAIRADGGGVTVTGTGGSAGLAASVLNRGVFLEGGGRIEDLGAGAVTVTGTGGAGERFNDGVYVDGAGSAVSAGDGGVSVTGTGGSDGSADALQNYGVHLNSGAVVGATGAGTVQVGGTAGAGDNQSLGVHVLGDGTAIRGEAGDLTVVGNGTAATATASQAVGVLVFNAGVIETVDNGRGDGAGAVSVTGTGGAGGDFNVGVRVANNRFNPGDAAAIRSAGGGVTVAGVAGGTGALNQGVRLDAGGQTDQGAVGGEVRDTAGGAVTLDGTGAAGAEGVAILEGSIVDAAGLATVALTADDGNGAILLDGPAALALDDDAPAPGRQTPGVDFSQLVVHGTLALGAGGLNLTDLGSTASQQGDVYVLIDNDGTDALAGEFSDAADDAILTLGAQRYRVDYEGGDGNDLTLTALDAVPVTVEGTGDDDAFRVFREGTEIVVTRDLGGSGGADELFRADRADLTAGLRINGLGGNDTLTVDYSDSGAGGSGGSDAFFATPVTFDGGDQGPGGGDTLILEGEQAFDSIVYGFTNAADGTIALAVGPDVHQVTYFGLEPITQTVTAANVTLNYAATDDTIVVRRDPGDGTRTLVTATDGTGAPTAESVSFLNPTARLTIDAGAGDDTVTIASVDAAYRASLTIAGGDGADTVNLNADLTLGDAAAGNAGSLDVTAEAIALNGSVDTTAATANAATGGVGDVTFTAGRTIALNGGGSITAAGGDVTLEANADGAAAGSFTAVAVGANGVGATVRTTGAGSIAVVGVGGGAADDGTATSANYGVFVAGGGLVEATGTGAAAGTVTITGTGGAGGDRNHGVYVTGAGSAIRSADGELRVTGEGGSDGTVDSVTNHGVYLAAGGVIQSGAGAAFVTGTGAGHASNFGVYLEGAGAEIRAGGGGVSVTGTGGSDGRAGSLGNYGVWVRNGAAIADRGDGSGAGAGAVTVTGTGGAGRANNYGVYLNGTGPTGVGSTILSAGGGVSVTGTGGSNGAADAGLNQGVRLIEGAVIEDTGVGANAGAVVVVGAGADGGPTGHGGEANHGVRASSSTIRSAGGSIAVTGTGAGAGIDNFGVTLVGSALVRAADAGAVAVTGTGAGAAAGVRIRNGSLIESVGAGGVVTATVIDSDLTTDPENGAAQIVAESVTLIADGAAADLGSAAQRVEIDADTLAFDSDGAAFVVDAADGLIVGDAGGLTESRAARGGAVAAANALTIAHDVTAGAGMSFAAGNSAAANDDLTITDGATVTLDAATAGTLAFAAGDDVLLNGDAAAPRIVTTGNLDHRIVVTADAEGDAGDGDRGSITQTGAAVTIAGANLTLSAFDGVLGVTNPGDTLQVSVDRFAATNAGANDVRIAEEDSVSVAVVEQNAVGGAVVLTAGGTLTVVGNAAANDGVGVTTVGGNVALSALSLDVTDEILTRGGAVTLTAANDIFSSAEGDVTTTAAAGVDSGAVTVTSTGIFGVTLRGDVVTAGAAGAAGTDGADGGAVTLSAVNDIVRVLSVNSSGGDGGANGGDAGAVAVTAGGRIFATDLAADGGAGSAAGGNAADISLTNTLPGQGLWLSGTLSAVGGTGPTAGNDGTLFLTTAGEVLDLSAGEAPNLVAGAAAIDARTGIGTGVAGAGGIDAAAGTNGRFTLAAVTATGDLNLRGAGPLIVGTVGTLSGARITDGAAGDDLTLAAAGSLRVDGAVTNAGGGDLLLAAMGTANDTAGAFDAADADLQLNANVAATGGDGDVALLAGGDLLHTAGTVSADGAGAATLSAGEDFHDGTNRAGAAAADLLMADGAEVRSGSGAVELEATRNVAVSRVATTGNATVSADDDDFGLADGVGAIVDGTAGEGAGDENVAAASVVLSAATGIGSDAGLLGDAGDLDLAAGTLSATNATAGAVQLFETDDVGVRTITNAGRAVVLEAGGAITDATPADDAGANAVNFDAGTVALRAADGLGALNAGDPRGKGDADLDFVGGAVVAARVTGNGDVSLSADAGTDVNGDEGLTVGAVGGLTGVSIAGAGDVLLAATGDLTVNAAVAAANVLLIADCDETCAGDLFVNAAVTAGAGGDYLFSANNVAVSASVAATGAGSIDLFACRTILLNAGSALTAQNGAIVLDAGSGPATNPAAFADDNFTAVTIDGATIRTERTADGTGPGDVTITGVGAALGTGAMTSDNVGVRLTNGGTVEAAFAGPATRSGAVTVDGTGGAGRSDNVGVLLTGAGAAIAAAGGGVTVTGAGRGLVIPSNAADGRNAGVRIDGGAFVADSAAGTVTVTGTAGTSRGNDNVGVWVTGTDGDPLAPTASAIRSATGDVLVTGVGGATGNASNNSNDGVRVGAGAQIAAAGALTVDGTGGPGQAANHGVFVTGDGSAIVGSGGVVRVTGAGDAPAINNVESGSRGVFVNVRRHDRPHRRRLRRGRPGGDRGGDRRGRREFQRRRARLRRRRGDPRGRRRGQRHRDRRRRRPHRRRRQRHHRRRRQPPRPQREPRHRRHRRRRDRRHRRRRRHPARDRGRRHERQRRRVRRRGERRRAVRRPLGDGNRLRHRVRRVRRRRRPQPRRQRRRRRRRKRRPRRRRRPRDRHRDRRGGRGRERRRPRRRRHRRDPLRRRRRHARRLRRLGRHGDQRGEPRRRTDRRRPRRRHRRRRRRADGDRRGRRELQRGRYLADGAAALANAGGLTVTGGGGSAGLAGSVLNRGVFLEDGGRLEASGAVAVTGTGGSGESANAGVQVDGTASAIRSAGGGVTVEGAGGSDGSANSDSNRGVFVTSAGLIEDTGTGAVAVIGVGGAGEDFNRGVFVAGTDAAIRTAGGGVTVTGTGGSNGSDGSSSNRGVEVASGGVIADAGTGAVAVIGVGGAGEDFNRGVFVAGADAAIRSAGGGVTVVGTGGSNESAGSAENHGVHVFSGGVIEDTNVGMVSVTGVGGMGEDFNLGVYVLGTDSALRAAGGGVTVEGAGGSDGSADSATACSSTPAA